MAESLGWQSFWWLNSALLGFTTICCIFLFPETRYNNRVGSQQMAGSTSPFKSDSREKLPEGPTSTHRSSANENLDSERDAPHRTPEQVTMEPQDKLEPVLTHQDPWLGRGKPSKQQWKLAQPYQGSLLQEFWTPWKLFAFPIVQFAAFIVSWSASAFLTINLTQSQVFAEPPYNFTSSKIGLFNFALLIGTFIGLLTAGPLSDFVAARLTKRRGGIREPEMRLLAMIPYVILMIIGNVIVAVGYEYHWDWKVRTAVSGPYGKTTF